MKPIPIPGNPQDGTRNPAGGGQRAPSDSGRRGPGEYPSRDERGYRPSPEEDEYRPSGERPRRPDYRRPEYERKQPERPRQYERPRPYGPRGEGEYGETPDRPKPKTGGRYEGTSTGYTRPSRPDPYGHQHPVPEGSERYESRPKPKPGAYGKPDPYGKPGGHTKPDPYGKPGGHTPPDPYGKPGGHSKPGSYGKPGGYTKPDPYGKPGGHSKPDAYGKPGGQPKPDPSGKPDPCQEGPLETGGHGEHGHPHEQAGREDEHYGEHGGHEEHGQHGQHGEQGQHGEHGGHGEPVEPALGPGRQNQKNLTPEARKALLRRIKDFIASDEDPVGYHRENGHVHGTPYFLPWHRVFLRRFEDWQLSRLRHSSDFIPLVFWDPSDAFPVEFRQPDVNPEPGLPDLWRELEAAGGLEMLDYAEFSRIVEEHHNAAHDALGGEMRDPMVSPRVPVFWLLHAFYDHVFHTWEEEQESAFA